MNVPLLWLALASPLLALAVACGGGSGASGGGAAGGDPAAAVTALAEDFLGDLRVGAWHAAFGRLHPDLQSDCGSAERLARLVEAAGERPRAWTLRPPSVRKSTGLISGSVEKADGGSGIVELTLEQTDGAWRIWAWSASNRELCLQEGG